MKKISILITLTFCFFFLNSALAADASKVAIVDLQRCMKESNEGKRMSESLKKEIEAMQGRYNKAQQELSALQKEIDKQSLMLSLDAKESKQNEYDKKNRELTYLAEDLSEESTAAEQNASQQLLKDIYKIIDTVAKQQTFDLVLEKSTAGILFASSAMDITDQVIKEYNKVKP
jgi:outer membrane protein